MKALEEEAKKLMEAEVRLLYIIKAKYRKHMKKLLKN
jgi:hypothetical protein